MTLPEKIITIYPQITLQNFFPSAKASIVVLQPVDGPAYIEKWAYPNLPCPTQEQLDAIKD